jgi:hypothetical protein
MVGCNSISMSSEKCASRKLTYQAETTTKAKESA